MSDSTKRPQANDSKVHPQAEAQHPSHINSVEILTGTKPQVYIGDATMDPDGTLVLNMRKTADGIHTSGRLRYKPGTKDYDEVLCHIGGIKPGEVKLVKPFEDDEHCEKK